MNPNVFFHSYLRQNLESPLCRIIGRHNFNLTSQTDKLLFWDYNRVSYHILFYRKVRSKIINYCSLLLAITSLEITIKVYWVRMKTKLQNQLCCDKWTSIRTAPFNRMTIIWTLNIFFLMWPSLNDSYSNYWMNSHGRRRIKRYKGVVLWFSRGHNYLLRKDIQCGCGPVKHKRMLKLT